MKSTNKICDRIETLKAMHKIVCRMNNENAYFRWIEIVPDEPDDSDFVCIAETDWLFEDAMFTFKAIMKKFLCDGIYMPIESALY